jgi:pSer/pThr/pTyr-binding forkhead associated (FHA) protein
LRKVQSSMLRWGHRKPEKQAPASAPSGTDEWAFLRDQPDHDADEMSAVHTTPYAAPRPAAEAPRRGGASRAEAGRSTVSLRGGVLRSLVDSFTGNGSRGTRRVSPAALKNAALPLPAGTLPALQIEILSGGTLQQHEIDGSAVIGRGDAELGIRPDIMLAEDDAVSRLHARIYAAESFYTLHDLDSTNGTCHNGRWLAGGEEVPLRPGDEIEIGEATVIRVLAPVAEPVAATPAQAPAAEVLAPAAASGLEDEDWELNELLREALGERKPAAPAVSAPEPFAAPPRTAPPTPVSATDELLDLALKHGEAAGLLPDPHRFA